MAEVEITWAAVALSRPEVIQLYVQENGPLPDGPVTEESWNEFREWIIKKKAESDDQPRPLPE